MKLPFPWTILVAAFFNVVLTRTARLWSKRVWVAAIPTIIWFLIFLLLAFGGSSAISPLLFPSARMILLFTAGMMGGLGPLIVAK
ncbi:hypothetical protein [Corynebacterium caspium]|uniref:hypothetical protein n=1 Tax=Corynebacterium caspium TaxID=234828 RepID=UPI001FE14914|nr:hypothetical protein [Corynebacterium caspium]